MRRNSHVRDADSQQGDCGEYVEREEHLEVEVVGTMAAGA